MTDEQIIIHGVDIRLFRTPVEVMHYLQQGGLYVVTKELFEQLKRKEQECERLKEKLIKWLGKEGLRQLDKEFYEQQLDQFKQTLTEIKEIARVGAFYWKHYKEESKRYNEILQKISEVEE